VRETIGSYIGVRKRYPRAGMYLSLEVSISSFSSQVSS
jgi:hypothetical protein